MIRSFASCCLLVLSLVVAAAAPVPARAQDAVPGASYITPFPAGDVYKLQVIGDGLAEGALTGLIEAFGADSRLQINRKHRALAGLTRGEADEDFKALDDALAKEGAHITVVMLGRDDRQSIRLAATGKRLEAGRDDWRDEYGRRADKLMKVLKRRGGAVYWIGLPVMQRRELNEIVQTINDTVRDRAYVNGIRFIDAYAGFADENGSFVAMGPDAAGLVRRLRESDGVSFTAAGNRKLAHFVEREIRRDLTQAKADRSIPLAGAEADQRKINPDKAAPAAAPAGPAAKANDPKSAWSAGTVAAPAPVSPTAAAAGEQKADNSRVTLRFVNQAGREEAAALDILRPAIPASVIQLIARNATPDKAAPVGDTLQDSLPGGLLLLSSVTPSGDGPVGARRGKLAPTQTPYFRVMVKGERLPPKPGRADDFRWPRPDQMVEKTAAPAAAAPQPANAAAPASTAPKAAAKAADPKTPAKRQ